MMVRGKIFRLDLEKLFLSFFFILFFSHFFCIDQLHGMLGVGRQPANSVSMLSSITEINQEKLFNFINVVMRDLSVQKRGKIRGKNRTNLRLDDVEKILVKLEDIEQKKPELLNVEIKFASDVFDKVGGVEQILFRDWLECFREANKENKDVVNDSDDKCVNNHFWEVCVDLIQKLPSINQVLREMEALPKDSKTPKADFDKAVESFDKQIGDLEAKHQSLGKLKMKERTSLLLAASSSQVKIDQLAAAAKPSKKKKRAKKETREEEVGMGAGVALKRQAKREEEKVAARARRKKITQKDIEKQDVKVIVTRLNNGNEFVFDKINKINDEKWQGLIVEVMRRKDEAKLRQIAINQLIRLFAVVKPPSMINVQVESAEKEVTISLDEWFKCFVEADKLNQAFLPSQEEEEHPVQGYVSSYFFVFLDDLIVGITKNEIDTKEAKEILDSLNLGRVFRFYDIKTIEDKKLIGLVKEVMERFQAKEIVSDRTDLKKGAAEQLKELFTKVTLPEVTVEVEIEEEEEGEVEEEGVVEEEKEAVKVTLKLREWVDCFRKAYEKNEKSADDKGYMAYMFFVDLDECILKKHKAAAATKIQTALRMFIAKGAFEKQKEVKKEELRKIEEAKEAADLFAAEEAARVKEEAKAAEAAALATVQAKAEEQKKLNTKLVELKTSLTKLSVSVGALKTNLGGVGGNLKKLQVKLVELKGKLGGSAEAKATTTGTLGGTPPPGGGGTTPAAGAAGAPVTGEPGAAVDVAAVAEPDKGAGEIGGGSPKKEGEVIHVRRAVVGGKRARPTPTKFIEVAATGTLAPVVPSAPEAEEEEKLILAIQTKLKTKPMDLSVKDLTIYLKKQSSEKIKDDVSGMQAVSNEDLKSFIQRLESENLFTNIDKVAELLVLLEEEKSNRQEQEEEKKQLEAAKIKEEKDKKLVEPLSSEIDLVVKELQVVIDKKEVKDAAFFTVLLGQFDVFNDRYNQLSLKVKKEYSQLKNYILDARAQCTVLAGDPTFVSRVIKFKQAVAEARKKL